jgi:uncharacterized protein (DUF302 family)
MYTRHKTPSEVPGCNDHASHTRCMLTHGLPSGRLGGPSVPSLNERHHQMLTSAWMESYEAIAPFAETLNKLRRTLSQHGFEIMRECDLGLRIQMRCGGHATHCRIMYVAEPELLASALSRHGSAALWLPIPIVLCEREQGVSILHPAEIIVRDRAALLGLRTLVQRSYRTLAAVFPEPRFAPEPRLVCKIIQPRAANPLQDRALSSKPRCCWQNLLSCLI